MQPVKRKGEHPLPPRHHLQPPIHPNNPTVVRPLLLANTFSGSNRSNDNTALDTKSHVYEGVLALISTETHFSSNDRAKRSWNRRGEAGAVTYLVFRWRHTYLAVSVPSEEKDFSSQMLTLSQKVRGVSTYCKGYSIPCGNRIVISQRVQMHSTTATSRHESERINQTNSNLQNTNPSVPQGSVRH